MTYYSNIYMRGIAQKNRGNFLEQQLVVEDKCAREPFDTSESFAVEDFDIYLPILAGGEETSRLGYGFPHQVADRFGSYTYGDANAYLKPRCWYNWKAEESLIREFSNYWCMIWKPTDEGIWDFASTSMDFPHSPWLFANEPERKDQANVDPAALAYLSCIWSDTVTCFWGAPGVVWDSDGIDYLASYKRSGGKFGDALVTHLYWIADPTEIHSIVLDMVKWSERNAGSIPVIISETNAWTYSKDKQAAFMSELHRCLDVVDGLAEVFWYSSTDYLPGDKSYMHVADLFVPGHEISGGTLTYIPPRNTDLGDLFASLR